jgi:hypothetical protein
MSKLQTTSSAIARAHLAGDADAVADARREHEVARIEAAIERALATAPPLTAVQIKRLSGLLQTGGQK